MATVSKWMDNAATEGWDNRGWRARTESGVSVALTSVAAGHETV